MTEIDLPENLQQVIMMSIITVKIPVLWQGQNDGYFTHKKNLRHGDPISPYLFVLCMEKLTHMILDAV